MSALIESLATRWGLEPATLKQTVKSAVFRRDADKATDADLLAVMMLAREHDLNPFTGEIQAFFGKGGMQVIIPHAGWTRVVTRHPRFERVEMIEQLSEANEFLGTTSRWFLKGQVEPICEVTAWLKEWFRADNENWQKRPRHMCGVKAYNHGAKRALGLGSVYDEDDAARMRDEAPALREPRSQAEAKAVAEASAPQESVPSEPQTAAAASGPATLFPE